MNYKKATKNDLDEIIIMKNKVKERIIKENLPIWKNGYPLDVLLIEDIKNEDGRIIEIDGKIAAYASFHHACKDYEKGLFKKDNLQTFGRVMVSDDFLGMHVGDYLVKNMINEAKLLNVDGLAITVDACNIKAVNLYKKYGFKKEGEHSFPYAYLDLYGLYFKWVKTHFLFIKINLLFKILLKIDLFFIK